MKPIIFSGTQPSGKLTLGNYIGAIRQWVKMQYNYRCIYCIVDLHAVTTQNTKNTRTLYEKSLDTLALYLASGINPKRNIIFIQSHVPEHSQLNWLLSCHTYFNELCHMIQFKEKSKKQKININTGLFNYPILMASDILLYNTNLVPVGKDQKQHLELTRNIAKRFNYLYQPVFTIPEIFIPTVGSHIMSLLNPLKKMSKSDDNSDNVITLLDRMDEISRKIQRAITDSDQPPLIKYDTIKKPGISNLLEIFSGMSDKPINSIENMFSGKTYSQLKNELIQLILPILTELQNRYYKIRSDEHTLHNILQDGAKKARTIAKITLNKVYTVMGLTKKNN